MRQPILSPDRFAESFNSAYIGAYRKIDAEDVRDMTACRLIGRYGQYYYSDLETVRATLQYEQLRLNRQKRNEIRDSDGSIHCRRCGKLLPTKENTDRGRPKEYCTECEPFRLRERNRKWRSKQAVLT
ncbi:hypothetical protein ACFLXC_04275 [Chloroflexota bacterium]